MGRLRAALATAIGLATAAACSSFGETTGGAEDSGADGGPDVFTANDGGPDGALPEAALDALPGPFCPSVGALLCEDFTDDAAFVARPEWSAFETFDGGGSAFLAADAATSGPLGAVFHANAPPFDGGPTGVRLDKNFDPGSSSMTCEMNWLPRALPSGGRDGTLLAMTPSPDSQPSSRVEIYLNADSNEVLSVLEHHVADGNYIKKKFVSATAKPTWHHIKFALYEGGYRIDVDGEVVTDSIDLTGTFQASLYVGAFQFYIPHGDGFEFAFDDIVCRPSL